MTRLLPGCLPLSRSLLPPARTPVPRKIRTNSAALFFTPERRQTLDRQRQLNIQEKQEIPEDPTLTIDGIVTRSSGKRTAWVNGVAQNENETPSGVSVTPRRKDPGKVVVQASELPAGNARVGGTVNRNTGEATDLLNGGRISTKSSATK